MQARREREERERKEQEERELREREEREREQQGLEHAVPPPDAPPMQDPEHTEPPPDALPMPEAAALPGGTEEVASVLQERTEGVEATGTTEAHGEPMGLMVEGEMHGIGQVAVTPVLEGKIERGPRLGS